LRFIVDGMLGSLARWLRLLGYETDYCGGASDDFLLKIVGSTQGILLTKDVELLNRARASGFHAFLITGEKEEDRLRSLSVQLRLPLEVNTALSRCPKCDGVLRTAGPAEIARVPSGTSRHYSEFWVCSSCGQIYWKGRHWKNINMTLRKAKESVESGKTE
jgi:uncharacterized protein with PIN domain